MVVDSGYFSWWQCLYVSLLWVVLVEGCQMLMLLWVLLASLVCDFPSSIFCMAGFVGRYCLNLVMLWNILFALLMVIEGFAEYSSLGLHLWSLSVCNTSAQDLLAFMISTEKSYIILIGITLDVTLLFSFASHNILFYTVCFVFWLLCGEGTFLSSLIGVP